MGKVFINVATKLSTNANVVTDNVECVLTVRLVNAKVAYPLGVNWYGLTDTTQDLNLTKRDRPTTAAEASILAQASEVVIEEAAHEPEEAGVVEVEPPQSEQSVATGDDPVYNQTTMDMVKSVQFTTRNIKDDQFRGVEPMKVYPDRQFERVVEDFNELFRRDVHVPFTIGDGVRQIYTQPGRFIYTVEITPPDFYTGPWLAFGGGVIYTFVMTIPFTVSFSPYTGVDYNINPMDNNYNASATIMSDSSSYSTIPGFMCAPDLSFPASYANGQYMLRLYVPWWSTSMFGTYTDSVGDDQSSYGTFTIGIWQTTSAIAGHTLQMFVSGGDDFSVGWYAPLSYIPDVPVTGTGQDDFSCYGAVSRLVSYNT